MRVSVEKYSVHESLLLVTLLGTVLALIPVLISPIITVGLMLMVWGHYVGWETILFLKRKKK